MMDVVDCRSATPCPAPEPCLLRHTTWLSELATMHRLRLVIRHFGNERLLAALFVLPRSR